jgi:hypothetical protein
MEAVRSSSLRFWESTSCSAELNVAMAKSKKQKSRIEELEAKVKALEKSLKRVNRFHQEHVASHVKDTKESLSRQIRRHESMPADPQNSETLASLRDAHSTIALLESAVAGGGGGENGGHGGGGENGGHGGGGGNSGYAGGGGGENGGH